MHFAKRQTPWRSPRGELMKPEAIVLRAKNNLAEPLPQVVERGGVCLEGIIAAEAVQKKAKWLRWYAFR